MTALAPRGMCACPCHEPGRETIAHIRACCDGVPCHQSKPEQPDPPKWKRPSDTWGPRDSEGKQEHSICGKITWQVTHSCSRIPRTEAAIRRWEEAYDNSDD
jgi:hypothetical protein